MKKLLNNNWIRAAVVGAAIVAVASFGAMLVKADTVTLDGSVVTSKNTATNAITVANNSNRMLIYSFGTYQGGAPSGVTYNGGAMTKLVEKIGSFGENCSIWGLVNPATGTHDTVVSGAGSFYAVGVYSLYGIDQNLPSNTATGGGDSNSASVAITTAAANSWVIAAIEAEPVITMTTSGGTQDWNQSGASFQNAEGQHILKATAGSQTMSASLAYGARWNTCAIEVKAATGGGAAAAPDDGFITFQ